MGGMEEVALKEKDLFLSLPTPLATEERTEVIPSTIISNFPLWQN